MVEPSGLPTNSVCVWSRQAKINLPSCNRMYPRARPHPVVLCNDTWTVQRKASASAELRMRTRIT